MPSPSSNGPHRTDPFFQDPSLLHVPWYESPFLDALIEKSGSTGDMVHRIKQFADQGYLVFDVELEDFDAIIEGLIRDIAPQYAEPNRRVLDGWINHPSIRQIASLPQVLSILSGLYGRQAIPFQTLNFDRGTQQDTHSDTVHFHTAPRHFMAGVWIAFEDTDDENGPLHYYPGSHKLPDYTLSDLGLKPHVDQYSHYEVFVEALMKAHGIQRQEVHIRKGQGLIWSANLFHGGSPIKDPSRTRHSQVTHYFFEDCVYYMPMSSDPYSGDLCLREVINVATGEFVPSRRLGKTLDIAEAKTRWTYPRPLPSFVESPSFKP